MRRIIGLSVSAGIYVIPLLQVKTEAGIGVNFRLGSRSNLYALLSVDSEPFPIIQWEETQSSMDSWQLDYSVDSAPDFLCPTFKIGFMF